MSITGICGRHFESMADFVRHLPRCPLCAAAHLSGSTATRPTRRIDPCPCECNSGGFCGGCGHAGCSGGINLR